MSRRLLPFAAAAAAFVASAWAVRPWRLDFPLDDDWAYLLPARRLAETGTLRLTDWASGTQVLHVAWGALLAKALGFNAGWLKVSTLLASATGAAILVQLLLDEGVPEALAVVGAWTLFFNPVSLVLSMSFMTDAPYLALLIAACWAYGRGLRAARRDWLLLGSAAAAAAVLVRQTGLLLPAAAVLAGFRTRRLRAVDVAAIAAAPAAAFAGYVLWFRFAHGPTWASENYVAAATLAHVGDPARFASDAVFRLAAACSYLGLFLLPVLAAGRWGKPGLAGKCAAAAFLAAAAVLAVQKGSWPYLENVLQRRALGTLTLSAPSFKPAGPLGSPLFWGAVTLAAATGGALFLGSLPALLSKGPEPATSLLAWTGGLQFAASLLGARFFDRYLLPLLPCAIGLLCFSADRRGFSLRAGFVVLAAMAAFSLSGELDYAGWNAAKWELGRRAVSEGHAPGRIAGGFDWDGWWTYEEAMAALKSRKPLSSIGEWEWQTLQTRDEFLSFQPSAAPPLLAVDSAAYFSPLAMREGRVYLYRLEGAR